MAQVVALRQAHSDDVLGTGYIVCAQPVGHCLDAMSKKPRRRRETPLQASNDNQPGKPKVRWIWDVYRAAARARYVGQVVASTADEAIEAAAVEFRTDFCQLIGVRR